MILSIDPGVNFCGFSLSYKEDDTIHIKKSMLIKTIRRYNEEEKEMERIYGSRVMKIFDIIKAINDLISEFKIEKIVVESPFYSYMTPQAYGSLLEVIFAIKYMIAIPNKIEIVYLEPLLIKKLFSNEHQASKMIMRDFLIRKVEEQEIVFDFDINLDDLSEHEVDAISVGFVYFKLPERRVENQ